MTEEPGLPATERSHGRGVVGEDETELVDRLRAGDADAFAQLVEDWSPSMLRLARTYVSTQASAEEIVQESWLAVIRGLDRFEGRSSLRMWVFRILTNQAKTQGVHDSPDRAVVGHVPGDTLSEQAKADLVATFRDFLRDGSLMPSAKVSVRPSRHRPISRGRCRHLPPSGSRGAIDGGVVAGVQWLPVREYSQGRAVVVRMR